MALQIIDSLESVGYVIVENFDVNILDIEDKKKHYLAISEMVGLPISHDGNNSII